MYIHTAAVINQTALILSLRLSAIVETARAPNRASRIEIIFLKYFLITMCPI